MVSLPAMHLYTCIKCHKIKCLGFLVVLPNALSCLNSIHKLWRPSLSFLFSAGSSFPTPAFSETKKARVTNNCKCDEIAVTSSPPPNGVPPPFKRPVSKHILKQIYNSSAPPLNLPWPPCSRKLQSGRIGDGSVAWKGHGHPLASKWEPWLLLLFRLPGCAGPKIK